MTDSTAEGSDEFEFGSVRFNDRDEIELYDGTQWRPIERLGAGYDWAEPILRDFDIDVEGPEPR